LVLRGAGATFPSPLYEQWFATYHAAHPSLAIEYEAVGSGEGVRRFIGENVTEAERLDFGASDAAMTDQEIARTRDGAVMVPVTAGSVVLAYNLAEAGGRLRLSREALAGIFLGDIRSWNDPRIAMANPGLKLPKLTIAPVVRQDSSGTTFAFTKHLDAISEQWRNRFGAATVVNWPGAAMRAKGNEGVAAHIQHAIGSVGYVGYEFARKLSLSMAAIENREGHFVEPAGMSGTAAFAGAQMPDNLRLFVADPSGQEAYPIVTFSWILLYKTYSQPEKADALRGLFRWALTEGQSNASGLGYIPLPPSVTSRALAALDTTGR
jgi:phosphate transport system substrate-binding protein